MNIFETASRKKFRYSSAAGQLSTEDLWDLPLTSTRGPNLNDVAKAVNAEIQSRREESFVPTGAATGVRDFETKLEIVKAVIAAKVEEAQKAKTQSDNAALRQRLMEELGRKQDASLSEMSEEEIKAKLAELDG